MEIHGKEYAEVKDRITEFRKKYPDWSITTETPFHSPDFLWCVFHARVSNSQQHFDGWAYEERVEDVKKVNFTSWVENCETSAIGRALANMDIRLSEQRPSAQEMEKVERMTTGEAPIRKLKLRGVAQAKEPGEKERLLQGIMSAKGSITALTGHDRAFQQALANRGVKNLQDIQTVGSLSELYESLSNYTQYISDCLSELAANTMKELAVDERDNLDSSLIKLELML